MRRIFSDHKMAVFAASQTLEDGSTQELVRVVHPGAAVILPLTANNEVVFIKNRRKSVDQVLIELPAGTLEPPELPQECAQRELLEESGYSAQTLKPLGRFYAAPGYCTEELHAFLATDLTHVGQQLVDDEEIDVWVVPLARVQTMIEAGEICDSKTLATLALFMVGQSFPTD